eukprot:CAMPEP_0172543662 /NCGR_PEP_ID=MMETSP1067-20121228/13995_1 /TAXON_ID=265564 ORGANISM="Thalassiosira punctigera, Strain Tpunct2005C2" /NCGR_SAMPLE_ID=MMETSP1067 /ASSEMBLY_ACC=CAM_ASM_000444 /LENGTH=261 /DNA_ID=CAMNT_0013330113 /DNA_START=113 /DNA_END=894 /DNA_ORIENTATION=-
MPGLLSAAPSSTIVERDDKISSSSNNDPSSKNKQLVEELGNAFALKLSELEEYQRKNGHCLVPKRYGPNPSLGNWVNKQRQNYRKFVKGEKTSMNEKRRLALDKLGFVWNASSTPVFTHNDRAWRNMYDQLSQFHATNGSLSSALRIFAGAVGRTTTISLPAISRREAVLPDRRAHRAAERPGLSVDDAIRTAVGDAHERAAGIWGTKRPRHGAEKVPPESATERVGGDTAEELQPETSEEAIPADVGQDKGIGGDGLRLE